MPFPGFEKGKNRKFSRGCAPGPPGGLTAPQTPSCLATALRTLALGRIAASITALRAVLPTKLQFSLIKMVSQAGLSYPAERHCGTRQPDILCDTGPMGKLLMALL